MAERVDNEYPPEATIGDQCLREVPGKGEETLGIPSLSSVKLQQPKPFAQLWKQREQVAITLGDFLRLTWDDIDWDEGVIVPGGGRKKTQVRQVAPLTEPVRSILEEIKQERKHSKIGTVAATGLVFVRDDGRQISGNAVTKALHRACKRAKVRTSVSMTRATQQKRTGLAKVFRLRPRCSQRGTHPFNAPGICPPAKV